MLETVDRGYPVGGSVRHAAAQLPASPDPASPDQFMVFFDWGKPDIRGDDAATLDQVAAAYRTPPRARLQLSGHTDRSGSGAVNRAGGLEARRGRCAGSWKSAAFRGTR